MLINSSFCHLIDVTQNQNLFKVIYCADDSPGILVILLGGAEYCPPPLLSATDLPTKLWLNLLDVASV